MTSVGKRELAFLLSFTRNVVVFCSNEFTLPLGASERLHLFIGLNNIYSVINI